MRDDVSEDQHSDIGDTHGNPGTDNEDLGTATGSNHIGPGGGGGEEATDMVNMDYYMERYREAVQRRIKSVDHYLRVVRRLDNWANLGQYTRRQLKSKGKDMLVNWLMDEVPRKSWRHTLSKLKSFWEFGIRMDWPVNPKRDLPRIPKTLPRETPPDDIVKEWAEAMEHEPDLQLRLYFYGIAEHGWRSGHLAFLEWSHVRWREGEPWAVVAQSERFKTMAPLITVLGPGFRMALEEWYERGTGKGDVFPTLTKLKRPENRIHRVWGHIEERYSLPHITPNGMRHWVSSAGHRIRLSKPALAGMLGHDSSMGAMADWYDNPTATAILEEQENKLPDGFLTLVKPPKVEIVHDHEEILKLWTMYLDGELSTIDFSREAEKLRLEHLNAFVPE